jgi:hypothetical protein
MDGRNVGELTSAGGYSRKYGRAIAMGYARAPSSPRKPTDRRSVARGEVQVDIAGTICAVTAHVKLADAIGIPAPSGAHQQFNCVERPGLSLSGSAGTLPPIRRPCRRKASLGGRSHE